MQIKIINPTFSDRDLIYEICRLLVICQVLKSFKKKKKKRNFRPPKTKEKKTFFHYSPIWPCLKKKKADTGGVPTVMSGTLHSPVRGWVGLDRYIQLR